MAVASPLKKPNWVSRLAHPGEFLRWSGPWVMPLTVLTALAFLAAFGFSLNNLSLMALTIGTGFVVDDAIVMIENIVRYIEKGEKPFDAALKGAKEIGFTVISLTLSLVAVFIPLLFMTGLVGRMFREFALTLTIAVVVSMVVSLTLTPMMAAQLLKPHAAGNARQGRISAWASGVLDRTIAAVRALAHGPSNGSPPCFGVRWPKSVHTLTPRRRARSRACWRSRPTSTTSRRTQRRRRCCGSARPALGCFCF